MKRGEIRWYKFQKPDKKRPVLILSRNSIIGHLAEITVAPITSTIREIPSEVFLSNEDGMPRDCTVNFDHIQTAAKSGDLNGYQKILKSVFRSDQAGFLNPLQIQSELNGAGSRFHFFFFQ